MTALGPGGQGLPGCVHKRWRVGWGNRIGYCQCLDCDTEIPLLYPLNRLAEMMERMERKRKRRKRK